AGFAQADGAVARLEQDFRAAPGAVFPVEVRVARLFGSFLQRVAGKIGVNVAGVTVGLNLEARGAGSGQVDFAGGVVEFNVVVRRGGEAEVHGGVFVGDVQLTTGIFEVDVVRTGAQRDISRRVDDFEIAGAGLHVAGELIEREIGTLGNEADALGNFFRADG